MYIYIIALEVIKLREWVFPILLKRRGPGGDRVLSKEYGSNLQDTFRSIGKTVTVTS